MAKIKKLLVAVVVLSAVAAVNAQQQSLTIDVDLVMVNATVTDPDNKLVTNLTAENFQIFEDKVEQQIEFFSRDQAPVSLGIVFDVSHSMGKKIDVAREAAVTFLENGTTEDEYFLIEFASRASVTEDFTADINRLRNQLAFTPAEGTTALYDAVYLGLNKVKNGQNPKKALLLITDGEDNHSRYSRRDIREFARESDVQIYSIDLGRALIGDLSEITGGKSFRGGLDELHEICEQIAIEMKSQYLLGYRSTNLREDGQWRKLQVRVTGPAGSPKLNVRSRDGYYAPTN